MVKEKSQDNGSTLGLELIQLKLEQDAREIREGAVTPPPKYGSNRIFHGFQY